MKFYVILGVLLIGVHAEKKINLDDIERDNLRAESNSKSSALQEAEAKYLAKPETNQQYQHESDRYKGSTDQSTAYVPPSQTKNVKYNIPSEEYTNPNKYAVHENAYQHQHQQQNTVLPEQNVSPLQYYSGYQQQPGFSAKDVAPSNLESQQYLYQPEIIVGNQLQSVQQKGFADKYAKTSNKESFYIDIPMSQLLSYYSNLDGAAARAAGFSSQSLLHQLAAEASHQVSLPLYAQVLNQKPIVPLKSTPVEYASKYATAVPATFTTKISKGSVYSTPVTSKKFGSSPLLTAPLYAQDQSYAQGKNLLYTQAYLGPSKQQYVPQFVYTQPAGLYADAGTIYTDFYAHTPVYAQDNTLHGSGNQFDTQQVYVSPTIVQEQSKQVSRPHKNQGASASYAKVPSEPTTHFVPPRLPAQDFKAGVTQLVAVSSGDNESSSVKSSATISQPRSLLDTYVPSNVIAAQDAGRYRERPLKLEGGFLPSKLNFLHKKRKSE
ncbi:hypothetical protein KM043_018373 [Ampulex compressa]|nr:hypothetical protein KM043_018373 [Ampulex compressa]